MRPGSLCHAIRTAYLHNDYRLLLGNLARQIEEASALPESLYIADNNLRCFILPQILQIVLEMQISLVAAADIFAEAQPHLVTQSEHDQPQIAALSDKGYRPLLNRRQIGRREKPGEGIEVPCAVRADEAYPAPSGDFEHFALCFSARGAGLSESTGDNQGGLDP